MATKGEACRAERAEVRTDLGLGLVDSSLVAAAEQHNQTRIATLNHRDFAVVRPTHTDAFELLPEPARRNPEAVELVRTAIHRLPISVLDLDEEIAN